MDKIGNVSVRKRADKYEYRFEIEPIDGIRRWVSKGGFRLKKEAVQAGREAREEYLKGGKPERKPENISFQTLSGLYLERVLNKYEPTTYGMYKVFFDKYFCPALGKKAVKQITYLDIERLMQEMSNKGMSRTRVCAARDVLNEAFLYAVKPLRVITENPVSLADPALHGKEAKERVPYTREQIKVIFETVPEDSIYRIVVILGIFCGMRIGEILGLTWDCIDFEKDTIRIEKQMSNVNFDHESFQIIKKPKSRKSIRTIHISETVKKELLQVKKRQEYDKSQLEEDFRIPRLQEYYMSQRRIERVVDAKTKPEQELLLVCRRRDGGHIQSRCVDSFMKTTSKKTGFHMSSHIGRHTHATILLEEGANIANISARLGHNTVGITLQYLHSMEGEDEKMADSIQRVVNNMQNI
ncbi:MAG: site-specific integrase [Lachnospiraceae bacterium]|nr:site-specific integrase [Lachnospiraceae bacterium]